MNRITLTRLAASLVIVAAIVGTSAATSAVHRLAGATTVPAAPRGHLMAYGGRSAAQQRSGVGAKFDAALADLARHANRARPGSAGLMDLHSMNPAAHFIVSRQSGIQYVAVDAVTRGDVQQLKSALTRLGMQRPTAYLNDVGGWLPVSALNAAAALPQLHSIRASMWRAHAGAVTSQGDYVQGSAAARTSTGADGTGITVGILSDSYDCYKLYAQPGSGVPASGNNGYASNGFTATAEDDIASGDLPAAANINILEEGTDPGLGTCGFSAADFLPDSDEGRAMMQVVHDVAPGAKLAFHTAANSEADFAQGIQDLATAGAKVIADDVSYFDEPFFQDGLVAQSVNTVNAGGVAYFSAAGNSGANGYDNTAPAFVADAGAPAGETLLNFDTTAATTTTSLSVDIPSLYPGEYIAVILQWDQPYVTGAAGSGGATSQMDLCISSSGTDLVSGPQNPSDPNGGTISNLDNQPACTGTNGVGSDPYQILIFGFPASAATGITCSDGTSPCSQGQELQVQVGLKTGSTAPHRIKVAIDNNGAQVSYPGAIALSGGTLQGHPSATGAMAVGAVFWGETTVCPEDSPPNTTTLLESYSAKGGDPILFDSTGTLLGTPEMRQKPDIAGPDGGSNTFLGFVVGALGSGQCMDSGNFPNFFGTSAATPHVAAVAAQMLQNNPALTPAQIYSALRNTASPLTDSSGAAVSGYGFIKADAALASTSSGGAVTVNLGLNPTTVNVGQSATLTWSSTNANSCAASGSWPTNGPIDPSGNLVVTPPAAGSYTYTITCINSDGNALESQTLTVVTPSSGGGGGGGGALDLAALLALSGVALARVRRTRRTLQA